MPAIEPIGSVSSAQAANLYARLQPKVGWVTAAGDLVGSIIFWQGATAKILSVAPGLDFTPGMIPDLIVLTPVGEMYLVRYSQILFNVPGGGKGTIESVRYGVSESKHMLGIRRATIRLQDGTTTDVCSCEDCDDQSAAQASASFDSNCIITADLGPNGEMVLECATVQCPPGCSGCDWVAHRCVCT